MKTIKYIKHQRDAHVACFEKVFGVINIGLFILACAILYHAMMIYTNEPMMWLIGEVMDVKEGFMAFSVIWCWVMLVFATMGIFISFERRLKK